MADRHPAAVLAGAVLAAVTVELAAVALLLLGWGLQQTWWFSSALLGCAAAFGVGLGVAYGATELVLRSRGVVLALLVGLGLAPLGPICGGYLLHRFTATDDLQAIDALWRTLVDGDLWRPALVIGPFALACYSPLLAARLRERDTPTQVAAMAVGGAVWLAFALALHEAWPVDMPLGAWVYALLLLVRVALTAPALVLADRVADVVLRRVRGADATPPITRRGSIATGRRVGVAVVLGGLAALGLGARCGDEPVALTVRRLHALRGPAQRHELVRALAVTVAMPGDAAPLLGVVGAVHLHAPRSTRDQESRRAEAVARLRDLVRERYAPAVAMAVAETRQTAPSFTLRELAPAVRPSLREGDLMSMRAVGEALAEFGWQGRRWSEHREGLALLERVAKGGDAHALLALAEWESSTPVVAATLVRRALRLELDHDQRRRAAGLLEWLLELSPGVRSASDAVDVVRVLDATDAPLDGAVELYLRLPECDGWGDWGVRRLYREVRRGEVVHGLISGSDLLWVRFSYDVERSRAGVVDGDARVGADGTIAVRWLPAGKYGLIQGLVSDARGRLLAGKSVELRVEEPSDWRPRPGLVTLTDADGRFSFADVPPGDYVVGVVDERGRTDKASLQRASPGDECALIAPLDVESLIDSR